MNIDWKSQLSKRVNQFGLKFQVEKDAPPPTILMNLSFIWYKNVDRSFFFVLSQFTRLQTNSWTDGRTACGSTALHTTGPDLA